MSGEAFGAILGYTGNIIGAAAQSNAVHETNLQQERLARYSYEQQRQMIAEQNEYNTPKNQMARYQEAGLNPNLVYNQGSSGNQSEIARYNAPNLQTPDVSGLGSGVVDAIKIGMALEQNQADLSLKDAQLKLYQQDYYDKWIENAFKAEVTGFNPGFPVSQSESAGIRGSKRFAQYDAQTRVNASLAAFRDVQTELGKLNVQEKSYLNKNLLPLLVEAKRLDNAGQISRNEILRIQSETEQLVRMSSAFGGNFRNLVSAGYLLGDLLNGGSPGKVTSSVLDKLHRGAFSLKDWKDLVNKHGFVRGTRMHRAR